jgi:chromosome segregation ATPase
MTNTTSIDNLIAGLNQEIKTGNQTNARDYDKLSLEYFEQFEKEFALIEKMNGNVFDRKDALHVFEAKINRIYKDIDIDENEQLLKRWDALVSRFVELNIRLENEKFDHILGNQNTKAEEITKSDKPAEEKIDALNSLKSQINTTQAQKELYNIKLGLEKWQKEDINNKPDLNSQLFFAHQFDNNNKTNKRVNELINEMQSIHRDGLKGKNTDRIQSILNELKDLGNTTHSAQMLRDGARSALDESKKKFHFDPANTNSPIIDLENLKNNKWIRRTAVVAAAIGMLALATTAITFGFKNKKLQDKNKDLSAQVDEFEKNSELMNNLVGELTEENESLRTGKRGAEQAVENLKQEIKKLREEIDRLRNSGEIDPYVVRQMERQLDALTRQLDQNFSVIEKEASQGRQNLWKKSSGKMSNDPSTIFMDTLQMQNNNVNE